ncbi:hypothetical protein JCM13580A_43410 [Streptomyces drozdowiczii]
MSVLVPLSLAAVRSEAGTAAVAAPAEAPVAPAVPMSTASDRIPLSALRMRVLPWGGAPPDTTGSHETPLGSQLTRRT